MCISAIGFPRAPPVNGCRLAFQIECAAGNNLLEASVSLVHDAAFQNDTLGVINIPSPAGGVEKLLQPLVGFVIVFDVFLGDSHQSPPRAITSTLKAHSHG